MKNSNGWTVTVKLEGKLRDVYSKKVDRAAAHDDAVKFCGENTVVVTSVKA